MHGIFLSQSLLTSQSLRAAIGPLQFSLRHRNLRNLTLHSGTLPYKHASRSLEIFSANTVLSHGSIMLPPHQPRVLARLAHWQSINIKIYNNDNVNSRVILSKKMFLSTAAIKIIIRNVSYYYRESIEMHCH